MSLYYQDLLAVGENEAERIAFVHRAILDHKASDEYRTAVIANDYAKQRNTTIVTYQKVLYTLSGQEVPDNFSANYKLCSNFFNRFITQLNQYLLGNGVTFNDDNTKDKLGDDIDYNIQDAGYDALEDGVSFGFWNLDHIDIFNLREFAPLYDEEDGALKAGIRFWQIEDNKPLRATLYEIDGYTEYIWNKRVKRDGKDEIVGQVMHEKRTYKLTIKSSQADGDEIYDGENYPTFPIVPLYANKHKQSEIIGLRENIDAYDLIKSGYANDLDDASQIYWTISNAGGMDDIDLKQFLDRLKTVKVAQVDDGQQVQSHTTEPPYGGREAILERLRSDMYDDFMALDTKAIAGGAVTATQIQAAYEPLNQKTDSFEYEVTKFIKGILAVAGIDDIPSFTRSMIVNKNEEISLITQSAMYLSEEYVVEKVLTLFGDQDQYDEVMAQRQEAAMQQADMMAGGEEYEDDELLEDEADLDTEDVEEEEPEADTSNLEDLIAKLESVIGGL